MKSGKKKKFRVQCGALVTVFRRRTITVSADSVKEAEEKAEEMFRSIGAKAMWDVDSVEIDDVEEVLA